MNNNKALALAILSLALFSMSAKAQELTEMASSFETAGKPAVTKKYTIWNGNYDKTNFELVIGYVNKSWRCTYQSGTQREDFFGDPDDKYFHGWQLGGVFTPSFDWGLGLRTGLFFEAYKSRSKWITDYCNNFSEIDLYIPAHATFRFPFTQECGLTAFGGLGFQLAMDGKYFKQVGTSWRPWRRPVPIYSQERQEYGNGWPQRVNWQAECGLNFRYKIITVSFTYSFGFVEHGIENSFDGGLTYETAIKSRQDKMQASISFAF